ncbi:hypothetical protein G6F24_015951 [Rhizopus arrhizus]|nr:hypothetical protein G6F24_015951 [Rhizopus arrhizus]
MRRASAAVANGRPSARAPSAAWRTSAALPDAMLPSRSFRLFSKPTRMWPPNAAAVVTQAFSSAPNAQIAQGSDWSYAARNGSRS